MLDFNELADNKENGYYIFDPKEFSLERPCVVCGKIGCDHKVLIVKLDDFNIIYRQGYKTVGVFNSELKFGLGQLEGNFKDVKQSDELLEELAGALTCWYVEEGCHRLLLDSLGTIMKNVEGDKEALKDMFSSHLDDLEFIQENPEEETIHLLINIYNDIKKKYLEYISY